MNLQNVSIDLNYWHNASLFRYETILLILKLQSLITEEHNYSKLMHSSPPTPDDKVEPPPEEAALNQATSNSQPGLVAFSFSDQAPFSQELMLP